MIIGSAEYKIIYPLSAQWLWSIDDERLSSGQLDRYDRGLQYDTVTSQIVVKGEYENELEDLITYLQSNRNITVFFENGENPFGPHIDHSGVFSGVAHNITRPQRLNFNYWSIGFSFTVQNPPLDSSITPRLDNIVYPSRYQAGETDMGEVGNKSSYGEFYVYYRDRVAENQTTFNLDGVSAAEMLKYFVQDVRSDGFPLPLDWQSLKPFAEKVYTHAFLTRLSYQRNEFDNYRISVNLLGYNDG